MSQEKTVADDVIKDAMERFAESNSSTEEDRTDYKNDWKFARLADQWPAAIAKQRVQEARPVLVINKLPALIRSVVNESRQNKPSIRVSPVDNDADEDSAEVIGGLIRAVERESGADLAYDTAIDQAVTGGFGFFRVSIDFAHEETFDLEARIERIPYAPMVHWDPSSTTFDASDWDYAFISEVMTKRQYNVRYPKGSNVPFDGSTSDASFGQGIDEESIRIAEYFLREEKERNILMLEVPNPQTGEMDLQVVREDLLPDLAKAFFDALQIDGSGNDKELISSFMDASGVKEIRRRKVTYHKVTRRIINGVEVLDEGEWPGTMIPICPVWGDETYDEQGRRHFRSMIRDAKDPQVMFNFWRSATTELVAMAPKSPWIGPKGFIPKGHETKWASANTRSHQYLEYDKNAGEAPRRQEFAGVPTGALQEAMSAADDMKSITGIFDSSLGARSNETSGKTILARERQGDVSNFHFIDNLTRAIRYAGEILIEIIPSVYSTRSAIRILGEDQKENIVNLTQQDGGSSQKGPDGGPALYNLSVGKYDVTVSTGPSFSTQREETRETLIEIMRQVPDAAAFLGDVLLDHMDFVGADKVAKRLQLILPEAIRKAEEAETDSDNPEAAALLQELQAKDQEFAQIKDQVMSEIAELQKELESEKFNNEAATIKAQGDVKKIENDSRELALKESAAVPPKLQWEYDRQLAQDDRNWRSGQNELDRMTDLAKVILNKSIDGELPEDQEAAISEALRQAAEVLPQ